VLADLAPQAPQPGSDAHCWIGFLNRSDQSWDAKSVIGMKFTARGLPHMN